MLATKSWWQLTYISLIVGDSQGISDSTSEKFVKTNYFEDRNERNSLYLF
jgi:hypothetical protein